MKKSTKYELPHDKPLLTVTVGEFAALMAAILNEGKAVQDTGTTARGLGELADRLGCGRSKVSELRRRPLKKKLELIDRENRVFEHDSTFFTFRLNNRFSESYFYR